MKVGVLIVTAKGLETIAKATKLIYGKNAIRLEVHKDDDTHGIIRLCLRPEGGWISIDD